MAELARLNVMNDNGVNQRVWADHRTKPETERELVPMIEWIARGALNFATMP